MWLPLLFLLAGLSLPASGWAEDAAGQKTIDLEKLRIQRKARLGRYPVAPRITRYLASATETADEGDPESARALLDKLNPKRLNPHERAVVFRSTAYIAYAAGDFEDAVEHFEKVLGEEILLPDVEDMLRFSVAQLHIAQQQWREAIAAVERWLLYAKQPKPLAYYLMAISYYQLDEIDQSVVYAEKAVDFAPDPKESWLVLLAANYVRQEDFAKAVPVLEEMVTRFAKKQYWVQLSLIYGTRDNFRHSLAVQQVAYQQGLLTQDSELRRLARSYLYHDLPHPAAQLLEKGLEEGVIEPDAKALELLANSWLAARESDRAFGPLQKAAELSDDGDLYVRLGRVNMQREQWGEAVKLFTKAIDKGDLKKPGSVRLLLGISYYNDQKTERARSAFLRAREYENTRERAEQWITHIAKEASEG